MISILFLIKVVIFSIYLLVLRGTMPRYRIDGYMISSWKEWNFLLLSFSLITLLMFYALFL